MTISGYMQWDRAALRMQLVPITTVFIDSSHMVYIVGGIIFFEKSGPGRRNDHSQHGQPIPPRLPSGLQIAQPKC